MFVHAFYWKCSLQKEITLNIFLTTRLEQPWHTKCCNIITNAMFSSMFLCGRISAFHSNQKTLLDVFVGSFSFFFEDINLKSCVFCLIQTKVSYLMVLSWTAVNRVPFAYDRITDAYFLNKRGRELTIASQKLVMHVIFNQY